MVKLDPPLRRAVEADAEALAELVNFAGEGMPEHLWQQMAAPGEDPWEIGRRRQAAKAADGQIYVIDEGAGAIASLTGYPVPAVPQPIPDDMPAMFRPLQELENLVPAIWYVNVLAVDPAHRRRGLGSRLLALAEDLAREAGLDAMSVIVADANHGAHRLYQRTGYHERARRPVHSDGWRTEIREWLLLVKPL